MWQYLLRGGMVYVILLGLAAVFGPSGPVSSAGLGWLGGACAVAGSGDPRLEAMQRELNELQADIQAARARQNNPWLNERRAQEVRVLVHEVLADADTRASLLIDEYASYYDNGFIIRHEDHVLLKIGSYLQFRHIFNQADEGADDEVGGFQTRRLALLFSGHIGSPRVSYMIMPTFSRSTGDARLELAFMKYRLDERWEFVVGQIKAPFDREWITSARSQPMIERSYVNAQFTSLYVQGVKLTRVDEHTRLRLSLHNGTWGWNQDFDDDRTDYALGVRGEWKVFGDWAQFKDLTGWAGDDGLLLGAAVQYDHGETGGGTMTPDLLKYTADLGWEGDGWNLFGAFTARHIESNGSPGILEADQWGAMIQGGVFIVPDKVDLYARYEWIDADGVAFSQSTGSTTATDNDVAQLVTVGTNWFLRGHHTKLSLDVVHAFNGLPRTDTGSGLRASDGPSTTVRSQVMVSF